MFLTLLTEISGLILATSDGVLRNITNDDFWLHVITHILYMTINVPLCTYVCMYSILTCNNAKI